MNGRGRWWRWIRERSRTLRALRAAVVDLRRAARDLLANGREVARDSRREALTVASEVRRSVLDRAWAWLRRWRARGAALPPAPVPERFSAPTSWMQRTIEANARERREGR